MDDKLKKFILRKINTFLEKLNVNRLDVFDPEISKISLDFYVLRTSLEPKDKVRYTFIPTGTKSKRKGVGLLKDNHIVVILDEDKNNPLLLSVGDLKLFVGTNKGDKSVCLPDIDKDWETSGYSVKYESLIDYAYSLDLNKKEAKEEV